MQAAYNARLLVEDLLVDGLLEDRLLRDVVAAPDDDAPRLVYADWLLERDDPRGELIQVQCALASPRISPARRQRLGLRERDLCADVGPRCAAWTGGLALAWQLRRGFVDGVTLDAAVFAGSGADLWRAAPLPPRRVRLVVESAPRRRIEALLDAIARSPLLATLEALELLPAPPPDEIYIDESAPPPDEDNAPPDPLGPSIGLLLASPHLGALQELALVGCALGDDGAEAIAGCRALRGLRRLDLSDNLLTRYGVAFLADGRSALRLTRLGLRHNRLGPDGAGALAAGEALEALEELDLGADVDRLQTNEIEDRGAVELASSARLGKLRRLDVANAAVGPDGARALLDSAALVGLRVLELGHNRGALSGPSIGGGGALDRLVELGLARTDLGDPGVTSLAAAPRLAARTLRRLDLSYDEISAVGATALADAAGLAALEVLLLRGDRLADEGAQALAWSRHVGPSLVRLDLAQNRIGTRGAAALAGWAALGQLVWLDLQDNKITDAGVWALTAAPQLARLDHLVLAQNRLTADSGLAVGEQRRRARQATDEEE